MRSSAAAQPASVPPSTRHRIAPLTARRIRSPFARGQYNARMSFVSRVLWVGVALAGAGALALIATSRGEALSSAWFLVAAVCVYAIGYRFYSAFLAARALALDDARLTPAHRLND